MKSSKVKNYISSTTLPAKKLGALAACGLLAMGISTATVAADVKISGWIFQTAVDRDSAENLEFQPSGNSGNQITFDVTHDLGNGLTAGYNLRLASFASASVADDIELDQRSVRLSGDFGTLDLGQNLSATAFADSYDATPTYWIDPMGWLNVATATGTSSIGVTDPDDPTDNLASGIAGLSTTRVERLRYVSPTFSGLTVRAQLGDSDSKEVALLYSDHGITANVFSIDSGDALDSNGNPVGDSSGFLIAYNAPFGLHAVYTASSRDRTGGGDDEVSGWKLGYSFGKHTVTYSEHTFEDGLPLGDYERNSLSYLYQFNKSFQVFAQSSNEERGSLDDDAVAFGAGIFF